MIKRLFTYLFPALLIAIYILSYVGFSIHTCSCEGSTSISVLIGNPSCEKLHAHIGHHETSCGCCEHHCHHDHHDGCCSTEVLVLTTEQDSPHQLEMVVSVNDLYFSNYISEYQLLECDSYYNMDSYKPDIPPLIDGRDIKQFVSQWRL